MLRFFSPVRPALMFRIILLTAVACFSPILNANTGSDPRSNTMTVGVAECPPFVISENGKFSGLGIYLWEKAASELGYSWEYVEYPLGSLLETIRSFDPHDLPDVGISCTSVTAEREEVIDFSHSFHETYTAIAVRQTTLWSAVKGFFSNTRVLKAILIILAIAACIGAIFYLLEHKNNKKLFAHGTLLGRILEPVIVGLMFVSNGPIRYYRFKSLTSRVLATILSLSSTFFIAAITAVLASSFTLSAMQTEIRSLDDLRNLQVGAVEASTSSSMLNANGIFHETRTDLDSLVNDLDEGRLDAVVTDAAFLLYRINQGKRQGRFKNLSVLPYELEPQNYAFILKQNSPLRESINRTLLTIRQQQAWRDKTLEYLGE